MIRTVIFRPPQDPVIHEPVPEHALPIPTGRPTVVRAACGATGISTIRDRGEVTCAECQAVAGRHPGPKGKVVLHKRWLERTGR